MASPFQGTQSFRSLLTPLTYIRVGHAADDGLSPRPKGDTQMPQSYVAALGKRTTIACELRLDLWHLRASKTSTNTGHYTANNY
jgi:hypothetical protein